MNGRFNHNIEEPVTMTKAEKIDESALALKDLREACRRLGNARRKLAEAGLMTTEELTDYIRLLTS